MNAKKRGQNHSFATRSVHSGSDLNNHFGAISIPIYNASTFSFPDAEQGAAIHEGEIKGYFYSRINNPTQEVLERALAELEEGESAIVFSSGMAAISNTILTYLKKGDHLIAPRSIYASSRGLMDYLRSNFNIDVTYVDATDSTSYEGAIKVNTRLLYIESPSNPTLDITDISRVVEIAKDFGLSTVMDNTFATPFNQNPLSYGVDVVIHSMTKYIGGHGDLLGGAAIGSNEFVRKCRWKVNKYFGAVPSPHTSWIAHRGIKTLALRMERHNENAATVAEFLERHPKVLKVHYPGLESHPQHALAKKQMRGFGGMISFEVAGVEEGRALVNNVELCTLAVSLGDVSTLIQHSASMTHASVDPDTRRKTGISDGLIRLSVGIEDKDDIIMDLEKALEEV
ncbi:MAG: PLP-dependent transferase [Balneola sp.]|nr:MAG: PLP-dependent transferase [Balneola sp.]